MPRRVLRDEGAYRVDSQAKLIHSVVVTAANAADSTTLSHLLHGEATRVWGDQARSEHVFALMKLKFGFVRVRYRGPHKNANRLFLTCALVNLFLVRKRLLCTTAA